MKLTTAEMLPKNPAAPFGLILGAALLNIDVDFESYSLQSTFKIQTPDSRDGMAHDIIDTDEGWIRSVELMINQYLMPNHPATAFHYDKLRTYGTTMRTIFHVPAEPSTLSHIHFRIRRLLGGSGGELLTSEDVHQLSRIMRVR